MTGTEERRASHATTLANGRNLFVHKFELTPVGIVAHGDPSFEEWDALGCFLQVTERAIHWWIGDWLRFGEDRYHEKAAQAVDATGLEPGTIAQYAWVAEKVPIERRDPRLSFSHHREVADLPAVDQVRWLGAAEVGTDGARWSADRLRREIKAAQTGENVTYWLLVQCRGRDDLQSMTDRLTKEGRVVKAHG